MIELLLQAERAVGAGSLDQAERLYWQAIDADSQNAIAIVGLAKVAHMRGDDRTAIAFGRRALKVDPENAVARRLVAELEAAHPDETRQPTATAAPSLAVAVAEPAAPASATAAVAPAVTADPAVAAESAAVADPAATPPPSASPADPGIRAPRGGRPDVEWPAADLEQVRQPRDR